MRSTPSSALITLLLLLTSACAQKTEAPTTVATASDIEAFRQLGLDAPATERTEDKKSAPLDLTRIAEAFAEAKTVTPEEADGARVAQGRVVTETLSVQEEEERPSGGAEGSEDENDRADFRSRRQPPAVTTPPAEKPADPAKAEPAPPPGATHINGGGGGKNGKAEEKKDLAAGQKAPDTVLAKIVRKETSARILVETGQGMQALVPRAIRTVVQIQGSRARTVIDYVFENPHERRLEGTFFQPMPADASPAGFSMFDGAPRVENERFFRNSRMLPLLDSVDTGSLEKAAPSRSKGSIDWGAPKQARVVGHQRARQVYEEIVRQNVDPALMEAGGGGDFEARVFPLEPKSLKRVVVAYEQTLSFDGTQFRYGFVMPDDGRILERSAEMAADSTHGEITGPDKPKKDGRWLRWELERVAPGQELAISVKPPLPQVVLRGRDAAGLTGDAFFVSVRPEIQASGDRTTGRAILMIDTSLSSEDGGAYKRRSALIRALLEKDSSIEQYAVMLFDVRPRWLHSIGWRDNSPENRRATTTELERVFLEGATNFSGALAELGRQRSWAIEGQKTTVFLFSDGHITWGLDRPEALPQRFPLLRETRFVTYQFGEESNDRSLFDLLSRETGGQTVSLLSEAEIDGAVLAHRRAPAEMIGVEVKGARSADVAVAGDPRLLFPGQMLSIGGRLLDANAATLVLRWRSNGTERMLEVPLATKEDELAPRAFAELHARRLISLDDPRLDRMVIAMSQRYRMANARASFLILDNEAQVEEYRIADENVDLSNLLVLLEKERENRARDAVGLSLEGVSKQGLEVLEILRRRADGFTPEMLSQPLLDAPFAGGSERANSELEYREKRNAEKMTYSIYERIARMRALSGDTFGAVRALSSAVELRPKHGESMRLVGYALLALAQYDPAVELFERLRILRSFEGEAFLEEALALGSAGRVDRAAENYEILLAREWSRHDGELTTTAKAHYSRLLRSMLERGALMPPEKRAVKARLAELDATPADFSVTTHWSSDQVDIDLWVYEPTGEKCFYQHKVTSSGELYWDTTDGLGPELYQAKKVTRGSYDSMVHYYGTSAPRLAVPAALLVVVDRSDSERTFLMRMLPERDVVLMLRTDVFD